MNKILNFAKEDRYTERYKAYLKLSSQREANISCLKHHIPRALEQLHLGKDKPTFNILSIGAGDGFLDQEILKIVQEGYLNADKRLQEVKILNTAVEPHPIMIEKYKDLIEKRRSKEESVEFDLKLTSIEEYVESNHTPNQYGVVHAIHSLYYVDSIESTLEHCYNNELGEKGLIACLVADRECIISEVHTATTKKSHDTGDNKGLLNADDVVVVVQKNKWKFEKVDCQFSINVTGILKDNSDEGRLLLDFLAFVPNFCQSADQEVMNSVRELLANRSTEEEDGRSVIKGTN